MRDREALHIYFTHKERQLYAFFWGGGGGWELAALMFLCDMSWENFDILSKFFGPFGNILENGYNITFALNSSVSSFPFFHKIYIVYIEALDQT